VRRLVNGGYAWLEANPVTVMLVALGLGAFATAAVVGVALRGESTRRIVEHSPCFEYPAGEACQQVKRETDQARSVRDTCIAFWKVDYPCPKPGSRASREVASAGSTFEGTAADAAGGGSRPAPAGSPSTGTDPPRGQKDHGSASPSPVGPAPPSPTNSGAPAGSSPSADTSPAAGPAVPEAGPEPSGQNGVIPSTVEAAGNAVEQAGNAASQVLCTAPSVLHPCPPGGP